MENEDPQNIINAGKMSNVVHERFAHALIPRSPSRSDHFLSFGQSPWLLQIIRRIPVGREVHSFVRLAAEMTRNRLKAKDLPAFRDLMSYLVRYLANNLTSTSSDWVQIEAGIQPQDLARDAIVAILGGEDDGSHGCARGAS